jgi:hypothetical protein
MNDGRVRKIAINHFTAAENGISAHYCIESALFKQTEIKKAVMQGKI